MKRGKKGRPEDRPKKKTLLYRRFKQKNVSFFSKKGHINVMVVTEIKKSQSDDMSKPFPLNYFFNFCLINVIMYKKSILMNVILKTI
ncbi:hypothetical protein DX928_21220 [Bacillus swezeyi]|uniref:Uncharacterized protein n=1 Tax=Bacillus swezeyi TaxID=1925020 RepID=A0A5M8RF59_9BACI|nr:hypothetical protein DX927_21935 [Bacillus swezeyi]KAA6472907.1 hypothetical protein DX928_21220 [Bacillus swezeyi]